MRRASAQLADRLNEVAGPLRPGSTVLRDQIVHTLRNYFSHALGKRPLIVPHVMEV
jgi:hypothetical protein